MGVLLSPLGLTLLALLTEFLPGQRCPSWVRWLARLLAALGVVVMTPWGANALVAYIEGKVSPTQLCQAQAGPEDVVLLSGGLLRVPQDAADFSALTTSSLRRLDLAVRLMAEHPQMRLIVSGGGPHAVREADVLASLAQQLGVPAQRVLKESLSTTTSESVQQLAHLQPALSKSPGVITSALHMPRALLAFRQQGYAPCALPAYSSYLPSGGALGYHLPQSSSLVKGEDALHELFGLLYYQWRTRLSATSWHP